MRRILIFLTVFSSFIQAQVNGSSCVPFSVPYPQMGINFPDAVQLPWINIWHCINPWHSTFGTNGIEFGADGWPLAGRKHRVLIGGDVGNIGGISEKRPIGKSFDHSV